MVDGWEVAMKERILAFVSVLTVLLAISSVAPLPVTLSAQTTPQRGEGWVPLRTAWGDPDFQGIWSYNDDVDTPFERPGQFAEKAIVEDEDEVAALLKERARRNVERAPTIGGETGAGPVHWYEFWAAKSNRTSRVVDPPDGRVPSLTPEALAREAARAEARRHRGPADSWEDRSLWDRCIAARGGLPHVIVNPGSYNNIVQILQSPGFVVILHEMIHQARIVHLDGRPHLGRNVRQYLGDYRGRWEGNTLVVDVTNFTDKTDFRGSRETLHLVERWTRVDANRIDYEVTVDDPATFTKRWTVGVPMKQDEGQTQIFEYACHEGNYGLANILSAARAEEVAKGK